MLEAPCFVASMVNDNRQKGFETLGQAAHRLLAKLDARKRPAVEMTARIAVLCRYSPSTADREAGTLRMVAMEHSTKPQGAAFPFGWEEGVTERELWGGRLTPPVPRHEAANRPDALDNTSQVDRAGALQRMGD